MLTGNPEVNKIYHFAVYPGGDGQLAIYTVPLLYLLMLYHTWRVRRLNFELFQSMTGLSFLLIALLTPASPGWFIWCLPFLVLYQFSGGFIAMGLTTVFTVLYVLNTLLGAPLFVNNGTIFDLTQILQINTEAVRHFRSLLLTGMTATGIVLA